MRDTVLFNLSNDFFLILLLQLNDFLELLQVVLPHFLFIRELLQVFLLFFKLSHLITYLLNLGLIFSLQLNHFLLYLQQKVSQKDEHKDIIKFELTEVTDLNLFDIWSFFSLILPLFLFSLGPKAFSSLFVPHCLNLLIFDLDFSIFFYLFFLQKYSVLLETEVNVLQALYQDIEFYVFSLDQLLGLFQTIHKNKQGENQDEKKMT